MSVDNIVRVRFRFDGSTGPQSVRLMPRNKVILSCPRLVEAGVAAGVAKISVFPGPGLAAALKPIQEALVGRPAQAVHVASRGITRMLDAESKPRTALLVLRERDENLEPNAATRMDKIFGKLLGLRTAAGFPPAFEYRPLFESLRSNRGDLVIERLRRPR